MSVPITSLHYAPNANIVNGTYAPGADGFNLADVSSVGALNALPTGVQGLVWLGMGNGANATFQSAVNQFKGDPKLFGFYLVDEPDPTGQYGPLVTAANLKAESDYIHQNLPGAKTFIVMMNLGTPTNPSYTNAYSPANTDIDLFGLDPYPIRPQFSGGANYSVIGAAVNAAESVGIPQSQIVPVYQAFGGGSYSSYTLPTATQEQQILATWGSLVPNPAFDYAYSWGTQVGDTALVNTPGLQQVFAAHNAGTPTPTPTPTPSDSTMTATDTNGVTATVPVIASGSQDFTGPLAGVVHQVFSGGIDTISATAGITSETLTFGTGTQQMNFLGSQQLSITGGSGTDTVKAGAGNDRFVAGTGTLDVTGGPGRDSYVFHTTSGLLKIEDFSTAGGDHLTVDRALRGSLRTASDGNGGVMLSFGHAGQGIDLVGVSPNAVPTLHFA
jgi:hypothetical protein